MSDIAETSAEPIAELPARGWTPERKMLFLDRLAATGNARAACRRVGLSAESAYRQRRKDALFARAWAAAVVLGRDASQQVLGDRAVDGIEEDVWHRGEVVGTRRRYDTRLLLAHLARLDALVTEEAADDAEHFEELLTRVGSGEAAGGLTNRQRYIRREADRAMEDARRTQLTVEMEEDDDHPAETIVVPEQDIDHFFGSDADAVRADMAEAEQEADEQAQLDAAERWDRLERVRDGTFDAPDEPRKSNTSQPLPDAVKAVLVQRPQDARPARPDPALLSRPRTVSTVSTSALARCFAGPPRGLAMTPNSPFDAPRKVGGRC